jgi:hypothetical protein
MKSESWVRSLKFEGELYISKSDLIGFMVAQLAKTEGYTQKFVAAMIADINAYSPEIIKEKKVI